MASFENMTDATKAEIMDLELKEQRVNELADLIAPKVLELIGEKAEGLEFAIARRAVVLAHQYYDIKPQRVVIEHDQMRRASVITIEVPMLMNMKF
ncbi:hypothetical protein VP237E401_P0034 [Vibrio phage 237E40-1]|nr:hypothetical protein VP237E401_P0034 [Vibrio phage 237E40-1]